MKIITIVLISFVALEHIYFMILEMFLWDKPKGLKVFGNSLEKAKASKILAQNQGLYNGFLATGLIWSLADLSISNSKAIFFLSCVVIAGVYGAVTTKNSKLFYVQSLPAILSLIVILFF